MSQNSQSSTGSKEDSQPSVQNYDEVAYSDENEEESSAVEMSRHSKRQRLHGFYPNVERELFAKMVAKHDFPLMMSQYPYFGRWVSHVMPMYNLRAEKDLMRVFAQEKTKICAEFEKLSSRVALSIDGWKTEYYSRGYFSVTCHFIDDNWVLRKRIIALHHFEYLGHGFSWFLSRWLRRQIIDWHIDKKIFSVMIDNASHSVGMLGDIRGFKGWLNDKKALLHGGDMFHFRSFADIIDRFVNFGLRVVQGLISKVRKSVRYIRRATERREKFELALTQCQFSPEKCVLLDVDAQLNSSCNSKCEMLNAALEIRGAFARLVELDSEYEFLPSEEEWDKGEKICACLNLFLNVAKRLSGAKYPTLNYYFLPIWNIRVKLAEWESSDVDYIANMASFMIKKFEKYWQEYNMVLTVATVLDPRYKMKVVEFIYTKIDEEQYGPKHIDKVRDFMFGLFSEYSIPCQSDQDNDKHADMSLSKCHNSELYDIYFNYVSENGGFVVRKNDLEKYLEEHVEIPMLNADEDYDVLEWWKRNGPRFPTLAKMARDVLAIPASSQASESAFHQARDIISDRKAKEYDSLEALVCLKDWLPPVEYECLLEETQVDDADDNMI